MLLHEHNVCTYNRGIYNSITRGFKHAHYHIIEKIDPCSEITYVGNLCSMQNERSCDAFLHSHARPVINAVQRDRIETCSPAPLLQEVLQLISLLVM